MKFHGMAKNTNQIGKCFPVSTPDISLQLLDVMFNSSSIGVAILDRRGRFEAINESLASINRIPTRAHIGKTLRQVLGNAAEQPEMVFAKALETGQTVSQFHMVAQLPTRSDIGHWMLTYRPIRDASKKKVSVCAHVVEITEEIKLQTALENLMQRLQSAKSAALDGKKMRGAEGSSRHRECRNPAALLEQCLAEARSISKVLCNHSAFSNRAAANLRTDSYGSSQMHLHNMTNSLYSYDLSTETDVPVRVLTARETTIMQLLLSGKTNKEVASTISISHRTVEAHRSKIMLKLRVNSLAELVRYAVRNHLLAV